MAARARSEPQWRSKWLLEPCLGAAGALEIAAQACSASLGRSNWLIRPARARWGARIGCSRALGIVRALEIASQANSHEETFAKAVRKRWALVAIRCEHLARFVFAPCKQHQHNDHAQFLHLQQQQ